MIFDGETRLVSAIPTTVKNQELVEKRREQIVLAAIKLFAKKGFHRTTLRNLAEEAGLSQGNIYDYVGSKEDIFFLIHQFAAGSAMEAMTKALEQVSDPLEKLRRMVRAEFTTMDSLADAIMLIYQEGHILKKPLLRSLLKKERAHLEVIESIIEQCVKTGALRSCNTRVLANLVKSMVDAWVLKRWDLRGHATAQEVEQAILDLLLHGFLTTDDVPGRHEQSKRPLQGKVAIVANGGTVLGSAIISFFLSQGVTVAAHMEFVKKSREYPVLNPKSGGDLTCYVTADRGPMSPELFREMEKANGPADIFVYDIGIGNLRGIRGQRESLEAAKQLRDNVTRAQTMTGAVQESMSRRSSGRIIYLAPWAWDKYPDSMSYEAAKGAIIALTHACARDMARFRVNVNCIVPGFIRAIRPSKIQNELADRLNKEIPAGRMGEISDITDTVLFLAGDSSKYLTGQILRCTGGAD
ncbi:MAG: SDR family oxidoreductase [Deltaproteobacteria bacterium]|nr:SDR family oxidoreductase [Deltaproteobacteria bacterium]